MPAFLRVRLDRGPPREIDAGKQVIPPEYRIETYKQQHVAEGEKPVEERLLVKKKADLSGDRVSSAGASYERDGWVVHLRFDSEGAKQFGNITAANVHHRFAIVLDGAIQSAPVIQDAIYGGDAQITGRFTEEEARGLASVLVGGEGEISKNDAQPRIVLPQQFLSERGELAARRTLEIGELFQRNRGVGVTADVRRGIASCRDTLALGNVLNLRTLCAIEHCTAPKRDQSDHNHNHKR